MPQIDFYILQQAESEARFAFACRLVEKAHGLGHRVYVHTENGDEARRFDELLWSYRPGSFLPHGLLGDANTAVRTEVEIGCTDNAGDHTDVLINLALSVPPFYERFTRVSEIVVQEPSVLNATRISWKFYSEKGQRINKHDMRK